MLKKLFESYRLEKFAKLVDMGADPYAPAPSVAPQSISELHKLAAAKKSFADLKKEPPTVTVAGRIMMIRSFGAISFIKIKDATGSIQLLVSKSTDPTTLKMSLLWDVGDIIYVSNGNLTYSKTDELTVELTKGQLVAKSFLTLPEKFHGLKNTEIKYRQRYLDLMMNDKTFQIFKLRSKIINNIHQQLDELGFLSVTTPTFHQTLTGAAAKPFITYHNSLKTSFYLRVAPELYLKKLLVGGYDKVYEMGKVFRNEGISPNHNPEFTILELYQAYSDMNGMMKITEDLIGGIADNVLKSKTVKVGDDEINLTAPFQRITMIDAVKEASGIDFSKITDFAVAKKFADEKKLNLTPFDVTIGHILNVFFETFAQSKIIQPTFIYKYPKIISPFAKSIPDDPDFVERFELFIAGKEFANAFSELTDPFDQEARFKEQLKERKKGNLEANEIDEDFLIALGYGLPPTGGLGIGIDRLVMLLTGVDSIKDIILFPTLKPEKKAEKSE